MNDKDFSQLIKQTPYTITKRGFTKTIILLDDVEFCDVPSHIADDMLKLLNGAYKEGVMKSKGVCDPFSDAPSLK